MEQVTVEWVMEQRPCQIYSQEFVRKLIGSGLPPIDVLRLDLPAIDLTWLAARPGFLSENTTKRWLDISIERTLRRILEDPCVWSMWKNWAQAWLTGEDRSVLSAEIITYNCAYSLKNVARAAAYAACAKYVTWYVLSALRRAIALEDHQTAVAQLKDLQEILGEENEGH